MLYGGAGVALAQTQPEPSGIPVSLFAQLPAIEGARLSPDGSHIAYFSPINGRRHLVIEPIEKKDGEPFAISAHVGFDFEWLHWLNDDQIVFLIAAKGRRDISETVESRLLSLSRDGGDPINIVQPVRRDVIGTHLGEDLHPPQNQSRVVHWLPGQPNALLLAVDGDHDNAFEVRRVDARTGRYQEVRRGFPHVQNWLADHSGDLRFGWGYRAGESRVIGNHDDSIWRRQENSRWYREGFFPLAFSASPDIAYMLGSDSRGMAVVRTYDLLRDEYLDTQFAHDEFDAISIEFDSTTSMPVGVHYTAHFRTVAYFDDSLGRLQRAVDAALPETNNELVSISRDRRRLLIRSVSDRDAGAYAILDRDSQQLRYFADAMPGLLPENMSRTRPASYEASDGLRIAGYLTLPGHLAEKNLPLVVLPVGKFAERMDQSFWYVSQFLASRGFAVLVPNTRGSSGYGDSFRRAGEGEWGRGMVRDVADGARWLIAEGIADPSRVCIVGWYRWGGYAAAIGPTQEPDLYRCAASVNGAHDLPQFVADSLRYVEERVAIDETGLYSIDVQAISPLHQAEHVQVPMLIIQTADNVFVPPQHGRRFARRLENLNRDVAYIELEYGGEEIDNEDGRRQILDALEAFLISSVGTD